ncbi:hypothetical protein F3Y22_tig00110206pilonHSYRG00049 [Hibiscus syriacus]|uniref:Reverse transcriptase domain-containing protein n=1 Tax=Hibiscus syriacus TaxID=106335 RepID=A0A6A3BCS2_HIBSY|nr:hypothetical protein F3Y22_tig00110206pilonHSYRG00049 [Hibiscus syriacus]
MGDPVDVRSENLGQGIGVFNNGHLSFRDMVKGSNLVGNQPISFNDFDVDVHPEDVVLGVDGPLPAISFSDRVHDAIDAKLANYVIIRLLGKTIGYKALLSRIKSLWNLLGEISLIDLDNDYYLFALLVRRIFSCIDRRLLWERLPGLPYRYYTRSLFGHIAGAIGKVVRVDYNTEDGKRGRFARLTVVVDLDKPLISGIVIDDHRQSIEYEELPTIVILVGNMGIHMNIVEEKEHWDQKIASSESGRQNTAHNSGSRFQLFRQFKSMIIQEASGSAESSRQGEAKRVSNETKYQASDIAVPQLTYNNIVVASIEIQGSKDTDEDMVNGMRTMFEQSKKADVQTGVAMLEPKLVVWLLINLSGVRFEFSYRIEASSFLVQVLLLLSMRALRLDEKQVVEASERIGSRFGVAMDACGDFNVIGNYGERQGGSQRRYGVCSKFGEFMFDTGLIDMGFSVQSSLETSVDTDSLEWDLTNSFKPTSGIRQGDPLSPYLFILCMERLSQAIKAKVISKDWKVIHLSNEGHGLSHLFFTDDLVLFAKASMIKGVLDRFDESGHLINSAKTQIFFSSNCPLSTRQAISQRFDFEELRILESIGGSVTHNRVTKATYSYLIDRLTQRLSGWMTKCLTLAGRITLAKATLQAIPVKETYLCLGSSLEEERRVKSYLETLVSFTWIL